MKTRMISLLLIFALVGCGTDKYPTPPGNQPPGTLAPEDRPMNILGENRLLRQGPRQGYLWKGLHWVGVSDERLHRFRCSFGDGHAASAWSGVGVGFAGGAIIGIVARASGSTFFGAPEESTARHPVWRFLEGGLKNVSNGAFAGITVVVGCQIALTGALSYQGLLGNDFEALSSALALGGASAIAATPIISRLIGKNSSAAHRPISTEAKMYPNTFNGLMKNIGDWSHNNQIGRGVRYRFLPGISIIGIGTGIGVMVYDKIQGNPSEQEIEAFRKACE